MKYVHLTPVQSVCLRDIAYRHVSVARMSHVPVSECCNFGLAHGPSVIDGPAETIRCALLPLPAIKLRRLEYGSQI